MAAASTKRKFETEVSHSARVLGLDYTKLAVPQRGAIKVAAPGYDGFFVVDGKHVPVELKSLRDATCFPFRSLDPHQADALDAKVAAGCRAYLLVNFRAEAPEPGKKLRANRAYLLAWEDWGLLRLSVKPRASVPRAAFDYKDGFFTPLPRIAYETPEGRERIWDLRALIGMLSEV